MNLPNRLTVGRIVLTVIFVMALLLPRDGMVFHWFPYGKTMALGIFILASLTDWWDGWLARRYKLETNFGALMDPLADKVLVAAAFICFIELKNYKDQALVQAWMVLLIVAREFLVTGMRLIAREKNVVLKAEQLGKHKTIWQMITIIVALAGLAAWEEWGCLGFDPGAFGLVFSRVVFVLMLVTVALTIWSGVAYLFKNRKLIFEHA
jgi:CDP-diacylglycerol--glycerol-3-phosphate 3-phosphatidyltransferase